VEAIIVEEKKAKKKSLPCVFGVKDPKNINGLNKKYMYDFLVDGLEKGEITKKKIEEFQRKKKECDKDSGLRKLFASMFMPQLIKEEEKFDFDGAIEKLLKD
jgi:hypothetical protein